LFDWEMYPAVPCNASSIYEIYKMKLNKTESSLWGTTALKVRNVIFRFVIFKYVHDFPSNT